MVNNAVTNIGALPSYYHRVQQSDKIEVPVPSNLSVFAQYKYVRGVPAAADQQPVSLNRAQIIDNMVSFLNNNPEYNNSLQKNEEFQIPELESEVHRIVNEEKVNFNALPGGHNSNVGIIFNLIA